MRHNRGFALLPVLLVVLAVLAVSGGAYWYEQRHDAFSMSVQQGTEAQKTQTNEPSAPDNDWQMYNGAQDIPFTLSYPTSYYIEDAGRGEMNLTNGNGVGIQILVTSGARQEVIDSVTASAKNGYTSALEQVSNMGEIAYTDHEYSGPGGEFDDYYVFAKNNQIYFDILVWGGTNDTETVKAILTSFHSLI